MVNQRDSKILCRICLECGLGNLTSLFEKQENILICDKINYIINIDLCENDGLPDKICLSCVQALDAAYEFKQKCERSNNMLRSAIDAGVPFHKGLIEDLIKQEPLNSEHDEEPVHSGELQEEDIKHEYEHEEEPIHSGELQEEDIKHDEELVHSGELQEEDIKHEYELEEEAIHSGELQEEDIKHEYEDTELTDGDTQGDDFQPSEQLTAHTDSKFKSKAIDLHLECHDCGQFFKSKCKLRVHWKREHLLAQLTCPNCKKVCHSYKSFHAHLRKKSKSCIVASKIKIEGVGKSRVYNCTQCDYKTKRMTTMKSHWRTHTGERPYSCETCNKSYRQVSGLQSHNESVHNIILKEKVCKHCGKHVIGNARYYRHLKSHSAHPCELCSKVLRSKTALEEHTRRHTGVRRYACEICAKMFFGSSDLYNHIANIHKKSRFYKCNKCEFNSTNYNSVTKHKKRHTDTNIPCQICGIFVDNEQQLMLHQDRHKRNFNCNHCNKLFYSRRSLLAHMRNMHNFRISQAGKSYTDNC